MFYRYKTASAESSSEEKEYSVPKPITQDDRILYVAALAVIASGLWGIWFALADALIAFFLFFSVCIGFACSIILRRARKPILGNLFCLVGALFAILLLRMSGFEIIEYILPVRNMLMDPAVGAAAALGLLVLILTFFLFSREALIFSIVPVLAIFGLLATLLDPRIMIGFLFYLLAAIFLLVYGHTLELKESAGLRLPHADAQRLPHNQLLISSGFFLTVLVIAITLTALLLILLSRRNVNALIEAIVKVTEPAMASNNNDQSTWSFTPMGTAGSDFKVGMGPINPGSEIVMYVKAERPELWRQRVYDEYTGHGWRIASGRGQSPVSNRLKDGEVLLFGFSRTHQQGKPLKQTFRLNTYFREGVPAAAQPIKISFDSEDAPNSVTVDRFGCIMRPDRTLYPNTTYTVYSTVSSLTGPTVNASLAPSTQAQYLQIPFRARRVKELVDKLVPPGSSDVETLATLRAYLASNEYTYTLNAKAVPEDADAVEFFLFKSKEGYCDLFASAFAIMARAAGISSRMAVGYGEGEPSEGTDEYVVRQSDGHAWVEVFLPDRGWVSIDPTPPGQQDEAQAAAQEDKSLPAWRVALRRVRVSMIFLALSLIVSAGLAKAIWFDPWWQRRAWEKRLCESCEGKIMLLYCRMCQVLEARGHKRQPAQTPIEYLDSLSNTNAKIQSVMAPVGALTHLFVASRYSNNSTSSAQAAAAQEAWLNFKHILRQKHHDAHESNR